MEPFDSSSPPATRWRAPAPPWASARSGILAAAVALLAFTLFKGLVTHVHDWPLTQLQLSYRFGPVRRGLVGTLVRPLLAGRPADEVREMAGQLAMLALAAWIALVVRELRARVAAGPLGSPAGRLRVMAVVLFAAAPVVWHLSMCLGYLDVWVQICGLVLVGFGARRLPVAVAGAAVAVLVHEMAAVLVAPLLLLCAFEPAAPWGLRRGRALAVGGALAALAGLTLFLSSRGIPRALQADMLRQHWTSDWWVNLFNHLLSETLRQSSARVLATAGLGAIFRWNVVNYLPSTILMLALALCRLRLADVTPRARLVGSLFVVVAGMSEVFLNLVAFDYERLFALTNFQAFAAFCLLDRRLGELDRRARQRPGRASPRATAILVAAFALVLFCELTMAQRFTYLPPMPRWWPHALDRFMLDPLARLGVFFNHFFA